MEMEGIKDLILRSAALSLGNQGQSISKEINISLILKKKILCYISQALNENTNLTAKMFMN